MNAEELDDLLQYATPEERARLEALLAAHVEAVLWTPLPGKDGATSPQRMAYDSDADIIGYGGAAGGGKTDLIVGRVLRKHKRSVVFRREKAQTEGVVQRMAEVLGDTDGYNSQKSQWQLPGGRLLELGGLDNPGDERRWQGRPHDLKAYDEVTEMREAQVRFTMGWNRTSDASVQAQVLMTFNPPTTQDGRWVVEFFGPWLDKTHPMYPTAPGEKRYAAMLPGPDGVTRDRWVDRLDPFVVLADGSIEYSFDPSEYQPEDIVTPKSRTFIPARLTDNPIYMATGYMSVLQALPEPLRSQMLYGDFMAGVEDDAFQVIPTKWVEAAQARWREPAKLGEMMALGVDVARGGKDNTVRAPRYLDGNNPNWFGRPLVTPGRESLDGPTVAGLVVAALRDNAPVLIDVIGVGASPYDFLRQLNVQVLGVNVSEAATRMDKSGRLRFFNLRTQLWWLMREALDPANNTGIALPPDPRLLKELTAPKWSVLGKTVKVESREDIVRRLGWSPDLASAYVLALMDVPKLVTINAAQSRQTVLDYDPMRSVDRIMSYDPMRSR